MADYDHQKSKDHGNETASTGCGGMFDFLKKKENDKTQQDQGVAMKEQERHTFKNNDSSDSSSSDEEADGKVEKKEKKGLKDKIKEKISGNKKEERVTKDTPNVEGSDEEKGFIEKIKDKLPGQHKKAEESALTEHNNGAAHGHEGEAKEKKGIMENIKEKLPVGHRDEEKPKEN
ncbi:hypothetical protein UlMin_031033 [Ulmus minor]